MRWVVVVIALLGCVQEEPSWADAREALSRTRAFASRSDHEFCADPHEPETPPTFLATRAPAPAPPPVLGSLSPDGSTLLFHGPGGGSITIRRRVAARRGTRTATFTRGAERVRIVARGEATASRGRETVLVAPGDLQDFELATTYRILDGERLLVSDIKLLEGTTGAAVGHTGADHIAAVPGSCEEEAILRFGMIPHGMPSFSFPINEGCDGNRCVQTRLAYMQAVHATWRMTQMMDVVASYPAASRSWVWGREGVDEHGNPVGSRSSPRHFFGPYTSERFGVIRELYKDHLNVLRSAHMDGIDLRLKCPEEHEQGGNGCFTSSTLAHHWVKGWVNICPRTWDFLDQNFGSDPEGWATWFDHTVGHEFYHHHYVNIPGIGWKMVKDTLSHRHGNSCLGITTEAHYAEPGLSPFDQRLTHLADYVNGQGEHCGHRRVLLRNVDTYNTIARWVGRRVWQRKLWSWPEPAPPTPQPPTCVGDVGCLCETSDYEEPDGDYLPTSHCPDNDGQVECMTTTINASSTVGICTACNAFRGPGCPCRDGQLNCDEGSCFGDDTRGVNSAWGQCFDEPPTFACLADCEELLGNGAFCMTEHPDHARCVPVGTGVPEASNCWWEEGHMDPQTLDCTSTPECGPGATPLPGADHPPSCGDLGYPPYFICDGSQRCVPDV